jgi:hypothetical protein
MGKTIKILAFTFGTVSVILILGIIFVCTWTNTQTNNPNSQTNKALESRANDTQRKNSVGAIWGAAQKYRQKTGYYPTNETVNSPTFQSEYNLSSSVIQDPKGTTSAISGSRTIGAYSYTSMAADGSTCNNSNKPCVKFKVTAVLGNGKDYSLTENQ